MSRTGADRCRWLSLALLALLAAVSLLAAHFGERSPLAFWLLVLFLLGPLLLALPGLLARRRRTFAWATLCVTPHFVYALTEIVANPAIRPLAAAMLRHRPRPGRRAGRLPATHARSQVR